MMITDDKLRSLFKAESEEHLQRLDEALLTLEKSPGDSAMIEEAFREAHSLKGAARMLGLANVKALAHRLEDGLNAARQGTKPLAGTTLAEMLRDLAEIRQRVALAVGAPVQASVSFQKPVAEAVVADKLDDAAASPAVAPGLPFRIDSVRVDTKRLDALMTHAGELIVTQTRMARRMDQLDALLDLCGTLSRTDSAAAMAPLLGRLEASLQDLRTGHAEDSARLDSIAGEVETAIREIRLLPLANVFRLFPRLVRDLGEEQGKEVELLLEGEETNADKRILEEMKDPLMHMLRNAVDHGIEPPGEREAAGKPRLGQVWIKATQVTGSVLIEVGDDGRGLDDQLIRQTAIQRGLLRADAGSLSSGELQALLFSPGFSTRRFVTDVSGRGVGLDVVRANVERLKGSLSIESEAGKGSCIRIRLPITLATQRVLLVELHGNFFGLPADSVIGMAQVSPSDIFQVEGRPTVRYRGQPVSVGGLAELLEQGATDSGDSKPCVFMSTGERCFGVFVDALVDEQEVVLKPLSSLLPPVRNVSGASILNSGEICMILHPPALLASLTQNQVGTTATPTLPKSRRKAVLLAEDSITTRTQEVRILEKAGYEVVAAVDGRDAYSKLATRQFDAVVSDINMPNMDGLELARRIRAVPQYAELPIILVTSLASDADKQRGLEVGANAYITKPEFDQAILLDCLTRLIG